jgi:peptidoglycan hydrolase-like protein with peptidoglycan-binding domain
MIKLNNSNLKEIILEEISLLNEAPIGKAITNSVKKLLKSTSKKAAPGLVAKIEKAVEKVIKDNPAAFDVEQVYKLAVSKFYERKSGTLSAKLATAKSSKFRGDEADKYKTIYKSALQETFKFLARQAKIGKPVEPGVLKSLISGRINGALKKQFSLDTKVFKKGAVLDDFDVKDVKAFDIGTEFKKTISEVSIKLRNELFKVSPAGTKMAKSTKDVPGVMQGYGAGAKIKPSQPSALSSADKKNELISLATDTVKAAIKNDKALPSMIQKIYTQYGDNLALLGFGATVTAAAGVSVLFKAFQALRDNDLDDPDTDEKIEKIPEGPVKDAIKKEIKKAVKEQTPREEEMRKRARFCRAATKAVGTRSCKDAVTQIQTLLDQAGFPVDGSSQPGEADEAPDSMDDLLGNLNEKKINQVINQTIKQIISEKKNKDKEDKGIDGIPGPDTRDAVRAFQKSILSGAGENYFPLGKTGPGKDGVDGLVGPKTWKYLSSKEDLASTIDAEPKYDKKAPEKRKKKKTSNLNFFMSKLSNESGYLTKEELQKLSKLFSVMIKTGNLRLIARDGSGTRKAITTRQAAAESNSALSMAVEVEKLAKELRDSIFNVDDDVVKKIILPYAGQPQITNRSVSPLIALIQPGTDGYFPAHKLCYLYNGVLEETAVTDGKLIDVGLLADLKKANDKFAKFLKRKLIFEKELATLLLLHTSEANFEISKERFLKGEYKEALDRIIKQAEKKSKYRMLAEKPDPARKRQ